MKEIKIPTWLYKVLNEIIGINDEGIRLMVEGAGEEAVQRHALQTIWIMSSPRHTITNPAGWFTMSLRYNWKPPLDMPDEWKPRTFSFKFRLDDESFMKILADVDEHEITILKGVES